MLIVISHFDTQQGIGFTMTAVTSCAISPEKGSVCAASSGDLHQFLEDWPQPDTCSSSTRYTICSNVPLSMTWVLWLYHSPAFCPVAHAFCCRAAATRVQTAPWVPQVHMLCLTAAHLSHNASCTDDADGCLLDACIMVLDA